MMLTNALKTMEDVTNHVTIRWEVTSAPAGKDTEFHLINELVKAGSVLPILLMIIRSMSLLDTIP